MVDDLQMNYESITLSVINRSGMVDYGDLDMLNIKMILIGSCDV